jgi:hypothetical protein
MTDPPCSDMATRFGLHDIPAFSFFTTSRKWAVLPSGLVRKPLLQLLKTRLGWPPRLSQPVAWLNASGTFTLNSRGGGHTLIHVSP